MFANSYFTADAARQRQRDWLARAERQRLARRFRDQSGTAESVEQPRRRFRRVLRAAFA